MSSQSGEFESASPHNIYVLKPVPVAGFIIYENFKNHSVKTVSRIDRYRPPVIVRSKYGWYIRYYYRIPPEIQHMYNNKPWHLFRVKEDMNRRKGQDRENYAEWLLSEITRSLKDGYNPFAPDKEKISDIEFQAEKKDELNATDAMKLFLATWEKRGLEKQTLAKYTKVVNRFIDWLVENLIPYTEITNITTAHVEQFLNDTKKKYDFGKREFNNHYDFIRTAFNFLLKKKFISESPMPGIDKMKSKSTKHRYYDDKSLANVIKVMEINDPWTLLAFQTVYYLCVRSEKELKYLKVGNINWEQNTILADETKGGNERYIPFDNNLRELYLKAGIDKYPDDYYIFGAHKKPSPVPFGGGYFSKRFGKIRKVAGLSSEHTMYGAKATRIIHLKQAGLSDADIMSLTGHQSFQAYASYLRDLGMSADAGKINKVSRKI